MFNLVSTDIYCLFELIFNALGRIFALFSPFETTRRNN